MSLICIHIFLHCSVTLAAMIILDAFLVQQNHGARKTGVLVMLVIEEFCHVVALRYTSMWIGSQIKTNKRGFAIISWFIFIVIYDIKMYFIVEHLWETCDSRVAASASKEIDNPSFEVKNLHASKDSSLMYDDELKKSEDVESCSYDVTSKKLLALSQVVLLTGLYLLLVGVNYIESNVNLLLLVKMRAFWTTADILDLIQLQTSIWEEVTGQFPYALAAFVYFFCYVGLMFLPPLSLAEMSQGDGDCSGDTSTLTLHRSFRISMIYIGTSGIRAYLLFAHNFTSTSTVFLGKNLICLVTEVNLIICSCVKKRHPPNSRTEFPENRRGVTVSNNALKNGNAMFVDDGSLYQELSERTNSNCQSTGKYALPHHSINELHQKKASAIIGDQENDDGNAVQPSSSRNDATHAVCSADTNTTSKSDLISFGSKLHEEQSFSLDSEEAVGKSYNKRNIANVVQEPQILRPSSCKESFSDKLQNNDSNLQSFRLPTLSSPPSLGSTFSRTSDLVTKPLGSNLLLSPPPDFASSVELNHEERDGVKETSFHQLNCGEMLQPINLDTRSVKPTGNLSAEKITSFPKGQSEPSTNKYPENYEAQQTPISAEHA